MDSTALAWLTKPDLAVTIDYGQLAAEAEIRASSEVSRLMGLNHQVIRMRVPELGSGDMAGKSAHADAPASDWWPFRNQLLITVAATAAINHGCDRLLIGTVASDGIHSDGTPAFVQRMNALLICQEGGLSLHAPAIEWTTAELVRRSEVPQPILAWSHSCHKANTPCCSCRGCNKHLEVLSELGMT